MVTTERAADDFKLGHKKSPNSLLSQHLIEFAEDFTYYHADYKSIKRNRMKTIKIDSCSFGSLVINGKTYTDDLIILPGGEILKPWWRKRGHQLITEDLRELIDSSPKIIVVGTGVSGGVIPDKNLESDLAKLAIEFIAVPNEEAIKVFNKLAPEKKIGGGFHLTC